jgi:RHS repeat-associated protein
MPRAGLQCDGVWRVVVYQNRRGATPACSTEHELSQPAQLLRWATKLGVFILPGRLDEGGLCGSLRPAGLWRDHALQRRSDQRIRAGLHDSVLRIGVRGAPPQCLGLFGVFSADEPYIDPGPVSGRWRWGDPVSIGAMMMTKMLRAFGLLVITAAVASMAPAQAQTTVRYLHTDALGTVVARTDANGNVVERTTFEPYGAVVGGAVADGPGYTGHVSDAATGLSYMQQRYYDPEVGLFLSVDPVTAYSEPVGQFNRYR